MDSYAVVGGKLYDRPDHCISAEWIAKTLNDLTAENARLREALEEVRDLAAKGYQSGGDMEATLLTVEHLLDQALSPTHPSLYADALKEVCPVPPMPGGAKE